MLYKYDNPTGFMQRVQYNNICFYNHMMGIWEPEDGELNYNSFGLTYLNKDADGYKPEFFIKNEDYKDTLFNDNYDVVSFWGANLSTPVIGHVDIKQKVHLVMFISDLTKIKPGIDHRADEEVRNDVIDYFRNPMYGFELKKVSVGARDALKEYSGGWIKEEESSIDQQPAHTFRLDFDCTYDLDTVLYN